MQELCTLAHGLWTSPAEIAGIVFGPWSSTCSSSWPSASPASARSASWPRSTSPSSSSSRTPSRTRWSAPTPPSLGGPGGRRRPARGQLRAGPGRDAQPQGGAAAAWPGPHPGEPRARARGRPPRGGHQPRGAAPGLAGERLRDASPTAGWPSWRWTAASRSFSARPSRPGRPSGGARRREGGLDRVAQLRPAAEERLHAPATRPAGPRACPRRAAAGKLAHGEPRGGRARQRLRARRPACSTRCRRRAPAAAPAARAGSSRRRPRARSPTSARVEGARAPPSPSSATRPGASVPTIATRDSRPARRPGRRRRPCGRRGRRRTAPSAGRRAATSRICARDSGGSKKTSRS